MKLIFIRHAEPDYSIDSLTPRGWEEADFLADRVEKIPADAYYCSPLGRAKDTAKESMRRLGKEYTVLEWLREFPAQVIDQYTGKRRNPWDFYPNDWTHEDAYYGSETWYTTELMREGNVEAAFRNIADGLDSLLLENGYRREGRLYRVEKGNTKTLVFFCHMAMQMAAVAHLTGLPALPIWQGFFVAPTGITMLETEERQEGYASFRCRMMGDISHLYAKNEAVSRSGFFNEIFEK
ncbi:MAG: histidine phosphatase family protein [Clostridiales bacterium]|nr:histidine phosphatase family protein [Clostridiales bacterium]